ncbi:MAG: hypothetical protein ABW171_12780, partial [Steroidobacter sp.]
MAIAKDIGTTHSTGEPGDHSNELPLCVDLDGTLISSDLLLESVLQLVKSQPWCVVLFPTWVLRGRAAFKAEVAARTRLNLRTLPYHAKFIAWLEQERRWGRTIWLCTAADESIASDIASHVRMFDGVLASNGTLNLAGRNKAALLEERFGYRGFDYCGNERRDLHVWERARGAVVVGGIELSREAAKHASVLQHFPSP